MKEEEMDSEVDINSLLMSYLSLEAEKSFEIHLSHFWIDARGIL